MGWWSATVCVGYHRLVPTTVVKTLFIVIHTWSSCKKWFTHGAIIYNTYLSYSKSSHKSVEISHKQNQQRSYSRITIFIKTLIHYFFSYFTVSSAIHQRFGGDRPFGHPCSIGPHGDDVTPSFRSTYFSS